MLWHLRTVIEFCMLMSSSGYLKAGSGDKLAFLIETN